MLIVLGGLPGTGKTTVAKALASKLGAAYLRVDEIEHALMRWFGEAQDIGAAGYAASYAIASSNLALGKSVVADCVNPVAASRAGWRSVARASIDGKILEVEILCSDIAEHQRRVETRISDIEGFKQPSWSAVQAHEYQPWIEPRLVIDTAKLTAAEAVELIERHAAPAS